jgi:PAS domain-containing protein
MGNDSATKLKRLRNQAEQLHRKNSRDFKKISAEDIPTLIQELQVHQIELEMQNDELRKTQMKLEESRNKYMDLYDFASIGYFSFDRKGLILEVNLAGADLLGVERAGLLKAPFSRYITREDQDKSAKSGLRERMANGFMPDWKPSPSGIVKEISINFEQQ